MRRSPPLPPPASRPSSSRGQTPGDTAIVARCDQQQVALLPSSMMTTFHPDDDGVVDLSSPAPDPKALTARVAVLTTSGKL